jgi:DNA-binding transcriptional regulator GbsR (MarR family)
MVLKSFLVFLVFFGFFGCSNKVNDRSRSYFSKEDNRVPRKRILKNIDKELEGIIRLNEEFSDKKENENLDLDLRDIEERIKLRFNDE